MAFLSGQLEPGVFVTFSPALTNQGPGELIYSALIIGQRTAAAAAAPGAVPNNSIHRVFSVSDVIALCGQGSIGHRQAIAWFGANRQTETWLGVVDDDGAGAAAAGTITVTGPATANGTIALYFGGVRLTVGVSNGDTANDIAAAIQAVMDGNADLPVTGVATLAVVDTTFRHKGLVGNEYDIRHSFNDGESLPAGVGLTIVQTTGGTANPDLSGLITNFGDQWWQVITAPYYDVTNLDAIEDELGDRDGGLRQIDGLYWTSASGSLGTLAALGNTRNSKYTVITAQPGQNPLTPPMEFAAEVAAQVAISAQADPVAPLQDLELKNALAPAQVDQFDVNERNSLLRDGISTSTDEKGRVFTSRQITTFQRDASGNPSTAWRNVETRYTLTAERFSFRGYFSKYNKARLIADNATRPTGVQFLSPESGRNEAIAWFITRQALGRVQNLEQFERDLVVEVDAVNENQLNFLLPEDLIPQLFAISANINFQ